MTSFNSNVSQYTPPKSDLLQKYIARTNAGEIPVSTQMVPIPTTPLQTQIKTTPEQDEFQKKKISKGKVAAGALGVATLVTVATVLSTMGARGKLQDSIINLIKNKGKAIIGHAASKHPESERLQNLAKKVFTPKQASSLESASINLTNGKDVATRAFFKKIDQLTHNKFNLYERLDNFTSAWYKRKGSATVNKGYQDAIKSFKQSDAEILSLLKEIENSPRAQKTILYKGETRTIADVIPEVREMLSLRQRHLGSVFSEGQNAKRFQNMDNFMLHGDGLSKKTTDGFIDRLRRRDFKSFFKEPVASDFLREDKLHRTKILGRLRGNITNNLGNVIELENEYVLSLQNKIDLNDLPSLKAYDEVVKLFEGLKGKSFDSPEAITKTQDAVFKKMEALKAAINSSSTPKNRIQYLDALRTIEKVETEVQNITPGETEKIMEVLKQITDPEDYINVVKPSMNKSVKALNRACKMESSQAYDKLRDINCGSAPTDIGNVILSTGILGGYTLMADNNDERVSIGLTTGIPIITAMGTCVFNAVNMISGKKALLITSAVSLGTKFVCDKLDKLYKKCRGIDENSRPSVVTIDDYVDPYKNKFENIFFENTEE